MTGDRPVAPRSKLLLLPFVLTALAAIAFGVWNTLDNVQRLDVVGRAPSKSERAEGIVRGLATFRAGGNTAVPPCLASYRNGRNTRYIHFSGDNRVRFADGTEYTLLDSQKIEFFQNDGPTSGASLSAATRAYLAQTKANVTFKSIACLTPDEKVWVEACVRDDALAGCNSETVLLTVGGSGPRVTYLRNHAQGSVAVALLGTFVLLLLVNGGFRHRRTVIRDLALYRGVGDSAGAILLLVVGALGTFVTLTLWSTTYGPVIACGFVALIALSMLLVGLGRLRALGAAGQVLETTQTTNLNSEDGLDRELAVRVAEDAPPVEGFRAGDRHALVRYEIREAYAKKKQSGKTVITTRQVAKGVYPPIVPIADGSGRGMLALEHCTIDVPNEHEAQNLEGAPSWLPQVVGKLEQHEKHRGYRVSWSAVQAGEPLLIFGGVERVRPSSVGAPETAGYREAGDLPLVRGQAHAHAIAYVGTEPVLTRGIRGERGALRIVLLVGVVATLSAAAAFAWLFQHG